MFAANITDIQITRRDNWSAYIRRHTTGLHSLGFKSFNTHMLKSEYHIGQLYSCLLLVLFTDSSLNSKRWKEAEFYFNTVNHCLENFKKLDLKKDILP